ncbi:MAG: 2-dehydropantoate 2-reductase [Methanomassiliicoccales archaeon]|nr:2-dehydropantoate 2-reductase [Methanomassiliicoccales archaeon]
MRILIFGAGALGSLIGALLSERHEVHLVTRLGNAQAIKEKGVRIEGVLNGIFSLESHTDLEDIPQPDVIFVTVKAYDTKAALDALATISREARMVLSLQNGLTNLKQFRSALPDKAVMGVTSMGATLVGPGLVRYAGKGETVFGTLGDDRLLSIEAAVLFREAGLMARSDSNIERELWMKGIVNASINPLTAILRCRNGELLEDEDVLAVANQACSEGVAVAEGIGVSLPEGDPFTKVREVMRDTAQNKSSMLQDLEKGKRTEIEEITGEIVRTAGSLDVSVPVNHTLLALVKHLERQAL